MFRHFVFISMYHLGFETSELLFVWIFFFFFSWLDPKKWNKKYLMKALLFEIAGCYKNYCKSLMSSCLPSILLFWGNNASSHFRKLCFVHFPEPRPDTMCLKQQQPAAAKESPGAKTQTSSLSNAAA